MLYRVGRVERGVSGPGLGVCCVACEVELET